MNTYTQEEAINASIEYFKGDDLAAKSFVNKYALKDPYENIFEKTPDDMHRRIAKELHRIELKYINPMSEDEIFELLKDFKYLVPQGGPMAGIGNNEQVVSLSNCFVIGVNGAADSYGAIFRIDQEQVQIMKRRGGCIEENQYVLIKNRGICKIKNCQVGDYILSYNIKTNKSEYKKILDKFYTYVDPENRIAVHYNNGTILRTSKLHPTLTITNNYEYKNAGQLTISDVCIKPYPNFYDYLNFDSKCIDIAWLIGAHIGDGSCNIVKTISRNHEYKRYRFRMSGDNEAVIKKYTDVLNSIMHTACTHKQETNIKHNCDVWRTSITKLDASDFLIKYLDNQIGKKTYTCHIPNYIKDNNLWIPFLAGLIDTDGNIDNNGRISIGLSSYQLISELACFLSSIGIEYNVRPRDYSKRKPTYNISYNITLHLNKIFYSIIKKYLVHNIKFNNIKIDDNRKYSHKKHLTQDEYLGILDLYNKQLRKKRSVKSNISNLASIIRLLKRNKNVGLGALTEFNNSELLTDDKYVEIQSRIGIKKITNESHVELKYIDIVVEDNNNYYAGDFGLVCTHNCGHDLSSLRPAGTPVKNSAITSTGVVPFMDRYSNSTREVAQDGRRGALMLSISMKHPDALNFINAKMQDGKVTGANVSVRIDDEFMRSVIAKKTYTQQFPVDSDKPSMVCEVNANEIWNTIIHNAWKSAEPGLLFWDTIIRESVPDCYADHGFKTISTNPCVAEGTLVNTPNGYIKVEDLNKGDIVSTVIGSEPIDTIEVHYNTDVYLVNFSDGGQSMVTAAHKYHAIKKGDNRSKFHNYRLDELQVGDYVRVETTELKEDFSQELYKIGLKVGILLGDGCYTESRLFYNGIKIASSKTDMQYNDIVIDLFGPDNFNKPEILDDSDTYNLLLLKQFSIDLIKQLDLEKTYSFEKEIPLQYLLNKSKILGIIDGLIATDGNILNTSNPAVRITTTSYKLANSIRRALLLLGIHGKIYSTKKEKNRSGSINGRQIIRKHDTHVIHILGNDIRKYYEVSHLQKIHPRKFEQLRKLVQDNVLASNFNFTRIKSIAYNGKTTVYDLYCKESDSWITDGYVQQGCGEIPLCPYDSCRLLAVNLYSYVIDPFTPHARFDFELFDKHAGYAQRMMDNIIDLEIEKVDAIIAKIKADPEEEDVKAIEVKLWERVQEMAHKGRRTGIGITAEGDMLAALGLTYGTDDAISFSVEVHKRMAISVYKSSALLARDRGAFGVCNITKELNNPFIRRLVEADPEVGELMAKYGRRNIALLTIAPTGTTSIMTQTTSGLEPVFRPVYKRRKKVNANDTSAKVSFIDETGEKWEEFNVLHPKFKTWLEYKGIDPESISSMNDDALKELISKSPYYKATADDVDWVAKVKMQGAVQKWVDHSISVTVNLPNEITEEMVSKVYMTAWESGCKGMTVYREGSRSGVLISNSKNGVKVIKNRAPKRPTDLNCDIHHITAMGQKWIVIVGLDKEGDPYEVFAFLKKNIQLPRRLTKGIMRKIKSGVYNLIENGDVENGLIIENIVELFDQPEESVLTRMISLSLRHGADIKFINQQLGKSNGTIVSFSKAIQRTLSKYGDTNDGDLIIDMGDEKVVISGNTCPNCGDPNGLQRSESCIKCTSCDFSICS